MQFVDPLEQIELSSLTAWSKKVVANVLDELFRFGMSGVDIRPLEGSRQECRPPILARHGWLATGAHYHEAGQVLVFRAEPIGDPGAHACRTCRPSPQFMSMKEGS